MRIYRQIFFSKIFDFDDWSVVEHIFQMLNKKWGNFSFELAKIMPISISAVLKRP
jgi:hypothetical protein